jgi:hypothetical protein
MSGYIYILREREFITTKETIYKIGRSQNVSKRVAQYPKGSELMFTVKVIDVNQTETKLLSIFRDKFKVCKEIGREYFAGDVMCMVRTVIDIINIPTDICKVDVSTICDPSVAVMKFVDDNREDFNSKVLKSKDVYETFLEWVSKNKYSVDLTHSRFTTELKHSFSVTDSVHRFSDGINRALHFPSLKPIVIVPKNTIDINCKKYTCARCVYTTSDKVCMRKHLNRKKNCQLKPTGVLLTPEIVEKVLSLSFIPCVSSSNDYIHDNRGKNIVTTNVNNC